MTAGLRISVNSRRAICLGKVRRVEGLFSLADQLEARLAQASRQVDQLTPSLLARAFAGQLVPKDPVDEPAEKLTEQIHASRKTEPRG